MANNRLYLVAHDEDGVKHELLLAKGWGQGWEVWKAETLAERIEGFLNAFDKPGSDVGAFTSVRVECETMQAAQAAAEIKVLEDMAGKP